MSSSPGGRGNLRDLRVLLVHGSMIVRSDADLIRLFVSGHREGAEAAFETLIARHGPMVFGICRRILRDDHRAEDAFQAVFLILARKARSVRVDDSLGRWLHGVARRVAVRAGRQSARTIEMTSVSPIDPSDPIAEVVRTETRNLIRQEIAGLPRRYREVVALCHIDGLTHDDAAEALGVPVGTVRSRLSRARDYLRPRLIRKGLTPSALASWFGLPRAVVEVPRHLLTLTLKNAGLAANPAIAPAVLTLTDQTMRSFTMAKALGATALMAALGCLTTGVVVLARGGEEPPKAATPAAAQTQVPKQVAARPLRDQFRRIVEEYDNARSRALEMASTTKGEFERWKLLNETTPDETDYARRIIDLAATQPKDLASRDYLIWVMNQPQRNDAGPFGDEFARAIRLLITYHADDPEVARVGLGLDNVLSRRRDAFLESIYACAENRETKGLIRLALAIYLEKKALSATGARNFSGRSVVHYQGYDDNGKLVEKTIPQSNEDEGYRVYSQMLDPVYVRVEAERLYEEVIAEYGEIPYITANYRDMERRARETPSSTIADPEKKRAMVETEQYLARTKLRTLGQVALRKLDNLRNLAVGQLAPDFEGTGVDGKPLKLSDYRGRVVVLAYWFSTCGPCLRAIPDERELVEKMKGKPFTLLGVVTDGKAEDARKIIESEKMTWPNVLVGGDKVAERYHVSSNPSYFVIDAAGVIQSKGFILPSQLEKLVEKLVKETESAKPSVK